jgi:uncharacterized protein
MILNGAFLIKQNQETVWNAIRDPALMAQCVPGCEMAERIDDTRYRARVAVRFGPIAARFDLVVEIEEEIAPELLRSRTRGEEGTRASTVSSSNVMTLSAPEPGTTRVDWSTEVGITGRLGRYGLGLMRKKIESLSEEFVTAFAARLANDGGCERGVA